MPLIERLMGLNADGSSPTSGDPDRPQMSVHQFFAAGHEIVMGRLTVAAAKTMFDMDTSEQTEMDELVALAPTGTSALATAQKAQFVESVHSVLILVAGRLTGYDTPAAARSKLSLPTP